MYRRQQYTWCSNGLEQDEKAVSGTIRVVQALTTRKREKSVSALYPTLELNTTFGHLSKVDQRGSVLKELRPAEHISTVSTYHAYKREGLRSYRASSPNVFYTFHRQRSQVGITGCRGCAFTMSLGHRLPISVFCFARNTSVNSVPELPRKGFPAV